MVQRLIAVQVTARLHPQIFKGVMEEKLDDKILRTPDDRFNRVLWLLVSYPDLCDFLKEATWIKLESYVRTMPAPETDAILYALAMPRLRQSGIDRLQQSTPTELAGTVSRLREKPDDAFIEKCITTYTRAMSFDAANSIAKSVIIPIIGFLNSDQAKKVIESGGNGQIKHSNQFSSVASTIKETGLLSDDMLLQIVNQSGLQDKLGHLVKQPTSDDPNGLMPF